MNCFQLKHIFSHGCARKSGQNVHDMDLNSSQYLYSSPSILQTSILRPPLIIRPLDLVPKGNFLCYMTFILRPPAI